MSSVAFSIHAPDSHAEPPAHEQPAGGADERELIDLARGNPEAFGRLYRAHHGPIASMLYRRLGDAHAAEDLAAQTFINAWQALPRYTHTGAPFRAWLMRIAINEARRWSRRQSRRRDVEGSVSPSPSAPGDDEQHARVRAAIRSLSLDHQDVITLVYFESLSVEQTAAVLSVRPGTVKSRLSRAREALKSKLGRTENSA